jgi:hypothetical protein
MAGGHPLKSAILLGQCRDGGSTDPNRLHLDRQHRTQTPIPRFTYPRTRCALRTIPHCGDAALLPGDRLRVPYVVGIVTL